MTTESDTPGSNRRGWLRFSIRGALGVVTVICLLFSWVGRDVVRHRTEQRVVDQLAKLGNTTIKYDYELNAGPQAALSSPPQPPGNRLMRKWFGDLLYARVFQVSFRVPRAEVDEQTKLLPQLNDLRDVRFDLCRLTDESVEALAKTPRLRFVTLHHTELTPHQFALLGKSRSIEQVTLSATAATDNNLRYVASMPNVKHVRLNIAAISNEGLAVLAEMPQLERLALDHSTAISDEGLASLAELSNMKAFSADSTLLTDQALQTISRWKHLRRLTIRPLKGDHSFHDAGCTQLARLTELRHLDLSGTAITDRTMPVIGSLSQLQSLSLRHTHLTDAGMAQLKELRNLNQLNISGTQVTEAGLNHLAMLPNLEVVVISEDVAVDRRRIGNAVVVRRAVQASF
ncbi:leucine-rich repeat domain-containing protein [Bremerella cremea]|uniref:leucine-rich repeat domain-containing protein n=1 Tax=Bremerella cremea TaxID=1031537 RepID=UPI0031E9F2C2